jgi:hypothetical protein
MQDPQILFTSLHVSHGIGSFAFILIIRVGRFAQGVSVGGPPFHIRCITVRSSRTP